MEVQFGYYLREVNSIYTPDKSYGSQVYVEWQNLMFANYYTGFTYPHENRL